mmetsp:Transcript_14089/g.24025  ORF Transcript_14089/g.24025 Transcript_14089/m.24025 type:complete len:84 (-) Transcript_14089:4043-4294(-)
MLNKLELLELIHLDLISHHFYRRLSSTLDDTNLQQNQSNEVLSRDLLDTSILTQCVLIAHIQSCISIPEKSFSKDGAIHDIQS